MKQDAVGRTPTSNEVQGADQARGSTPSLWWTILLYLTFFLGCLVLVFTDKWYQPVAISLGKMF